MNLFTHSIILTKRFERYGGDSEYTLALVVTNKGQALIYHEDNHKMKSITSYAPYVHWLINNSMDLLILSENNTFNDIYNNWWYEEGDRNNEYQRRKEFRDILSSF